MIGDLTPRKGHFFLSPWQRHGKTVPPKKCGLKGQPNMPGPSERVASSWCAPWRAETLRFSLRVGMIQRIGFFWMMSDLPPRKGHFSFSPWQRHGKTVPQKECALKGHPNMPGPSERVASSWCAPLGAETLRLSLRVGMSARSLQLGFKDGGLKTASNVDLRGLEGGLFRILWRASVVRRATARRRSCR
jgi:hypothetical protein